MKKPVALCAFAAITFSAAPFLSPLTADAQACKGVTERTHVASDFDNKMHWYETKLNSCDTEKTLEQLHHASGAAALGGLIGIAVPPIGMASAAVGVWAWQNQDAFRDCAEHGTGVSFKEVNGAIVDCCPQ